MTDIFVDVAELSCTGPAAPAHESIRQRLQDALGMTAVNMWIGPVQIAEGLREPVRPRLEHEPFMRQVFTGRDGKPEFEGHVESRCRRWSAIEGHAGEIVEGIPAGTKETDDPIESSLAA